MKQFKGKFNYDAETGVSTAELYTSMGLCTGKAQLHPEDKEHDSNYFGCAIAELRAEAVYCKRRAQHSMQEAQTLQKFYNHMKDTKNFDENAYYVKQLKKEIQRKYEDADQWRLRAAAIKDMIQLRIIARDKINKQKENDN